MSPIITSVDLSKYPEPGTDEYNFLPSEEQFRLDEFHTYTAEATSVEPGIPVLSMINCGEVLDDGDYCYGPVELVRYQVPSQIRWTCLECGQKGTIIGFENSISDLSGLSREEAETVLYERYGEEPIDDDLIDNEFDLFEIPPEEEEDFVKWFVNISQEEKEQILNHLGVDIDQINHEFGRTTGGLEPDKLYQLLISDWENPKGPLQLNRNLNADDVEHTFFFHNARNILVKAQKNGIGLTERGNLKRKEILEYIENGIWPDGYIERVKEYNKVINEHDIWLLHSLRILLEVAGLVRKYKGKLAGLKKNAAITEENQAGELYCRLFITYFRSMNIAYLPNFWQDFNLIQECVPYTLFRLQQKASGWTPGDALFRETLLMNAQAEAFESLLYDFQKPEELFYDLVLRPLELFGIIESKLTGEPGRWFSRPNQFRKTPLFDKLITFRFAP